MPRLPAIGRRPRFLLALAFLLIGSVPAAAQRGVRSGPPQQGLSPGVALLTFGPDDPDIPAYFDLSITAPVLVYSRRGMHVSLLRGSESTIVEGNPADHTLLDLTVQAFGDYRIYGADRGAGFRLFIPVMLTSAYRKVERSQAEATLALFEYTGVGLGGGLGFTNQGQRWSLQARATPSIGFATRSFGNSTGRWLGFDVDAWVFYGPLVRGFGLSLGYAFGWQQWRVGGPDAIGIAGSGRFNYSGATHSVRIGISW